MNTRVYLRSGRRRIGYPTEFSPGGLHILDAGPDPEDSGRRLAIAVRLTDG
ncbi:MAG: hypothetical protein ABFS86_04815 [Planctomycetota bacterium]